MSPVQPSAIRSEALVEVGWVVLEPLEPLDREAVHAACARAEEWLKRELPEFSWSVPLSERKETLEESRVSPVRLVDIGIFERETKRWDFAFVVTGAELAGQRRRFTAGATSRSASVSVASTLPIDPAESRQSPTEDERRQRIEARLLAMFVRTLAILTGLDPEHLGLGDESDFEHDLPGLQDEGRRMLSDRLARVADPRVEEGLVGRLGTPAFYLRALAADPWAVPSMVRWARPWMFPLRLGRMSAAALSVLFVVMLTAEAWELGATRTWGQVLALASCVLVCTTVLVVARQGLVEEGRKLTEQTALSNVATVITVGLGLASTLFFLFLVSWVVSLLFFDEVVGGWIGHGRGLTPATAAIFSCFAAAIGIVAGALGASFEEEDDFHHMARIDREL